MKLENQVCSMQQAKHLAELGVEQHQSLFAWTCVMPDPSGEQYSFEILYTDSPPQTLEEFIASAFTVAELGVMLPAGKYDTCGWSDGWRIYTEDGHDAIGDVTFSSEADARASVLIHLLENKHITAEEVNNRLQSA